MAVRAALLISLLGLAGCAGVTGGRPFHLTAEQVNGAWGAVWARELRQAEAEGTSPFWNPPPSYSAAECRWLEPGRKARCRYRVARGYHRPGGARHWVAEEGELYLTETGWDFGG
jgi:hypothetical protein